MTRTTEDVLRLRPDIKGEEELRHEIAMRIPFRAFLVAFEIEPPVRDALMVRVKYRHDEP